MTWTDDQITARIKRHIIVTAVGKFVSDEMAAELMRQVRDSYAAEIVEMQATINALTAETQSLRQK